MPVAPAATPISSEARQPGGAVRGGALRVPATALGVVLTVGSAAVLFRHLGVDDSGRYVLVLALVTLFGGVTDAGLSTIGVREIAARGGMRARAAAAEPARPADRLHRASASLLACAYAVARGLRPRARRWAPRSPGPD